MMLSCKDYSLVPRAGGVLLRQSQKLLVNAGGAALKEMMSQRVR